MAAGQALAATAEPTTFDVRTQITWNPSDRIWTAALPAEGCGPRLIEATGDLAYAAPLRRASFERRGELVAEFNAPRLMTPIVRGRARDCAAEASASASLPAMLSATAGSFETFQGAFAACLSRTGSAKHLGSMRLWIDTSCNW